MTPDGEFVVQGDVLLTVRALPTLGIEYDESGNVKAVSMKRANGQPKMFEGAAEDLAYQIPQQAQTESQVERVNQELDQDEEFQRDHDQYVNRNKKEPDETPELPRPLQMKYLKKHLLNQSQPQSPSSQGQSSPRTQTNNARGAGQAPKEDDVFLPAKAEELCLASQLAASKTLATSLEEKALAAGLSAPGPLGFDGM